MSGEMYRSELWRICCTPYVGYISIYIYVEVQVLYCTYKIGRRILSAIQPRYVVQLS